MALLLDHERAARAEEECGAVVQARAQDGVDSDVVMELERLCTAAAALRPRDSIRDPNTEPRQCGVTEREPAAGHGRESLGSILVRHDPEPGAELERVPGIVDGRCGLHAVLRVCTAREEET